MEFALRVLTKVSREISLENVEKHSIDIILGMDDAISMGYRESITIQEVEQQLKM